ncbi:MAG TPA: retroviral-like aspartic protease family protein [Gammaproteobacteria bacterium]|nr:retroviral-like aspartic protease family protein [Gammaproteobacteria bacterium]
MNIRLRGLLALGALALMLAGCENTPPAELKADAIQCMRDNDLSCAERRWEEYLDVQPNDASAMATLGIVQSQQGEDKGAVENLQKAISAGEGTYDLFAAYATSLGRLGKTDEAIDWSYKTLAVVPSLVDVRGDLAKLLVKKQRPYEALGLLSAFDEHLQAMGQQSYFEGQRIAIESSVKQVEGAAEKSQLRLSKMDGNFMVPVVLGQAPASDFVVDTGATFTTVSERFLQDSKAHYNVAVKSLAMRIADGRSVLGRGVTIDSMKVGPFELHDVQVMVCPGCQLLLGQAALSRFDLSSNQVQGVEFLTLKPRD